MPSGLSEYRNAEPCLAPPYRAAPYHTLPHQAKPNRDKTRRATVIPRRAATRACLTQILPCPAECGHALPERTEPDPRQ